MPTPDQYRAARTLLALTQSMVSERTGMSRQTIKRLECTWDEVPVDRKHRQYYDCWLREYARLSKPELLTAVDSILGNEQFARMFQIVEPGLIRKPGNPRPTEIIELGLKFETMVQCAEYLIDNGYTKAETKTISAHIRNAITGEGPRTYLGFTYRWLDEDSAEAEARAKEKRRRRREKNLRTRRLIQRRASAIAADLVKQQNETKKSED